jgi:hypothetical protein
MTDDEWYDDLFEKLDEAVVRVVTTQGFRYPMHVTLHWADGQYFAYIDPAKDEQSEFLTALAAVHPSENIFPATVVVREFDAATKQTGSRWFSATLGAFEPEEMDGVAKRIVEPE